MSVVSTFPASARNSRAPETQRLLGRRAGLAAAAAGAGYTASWAAGLALPVPNLAVTASGTDVIARYAGQPGAVQAQFLLTEGLPAIGLAVVAGSLALAAGRAGARRPALVAAVSGVVAAVISLTQYVLGVALAGWALPGRATGTAGALFEAASRLDGAKMLALAGLAAATAELAGRSGMLPRWLQYAGVALAASITVSGIGYLLLIQALTPAAYPAGVALLIMVTGTGLALGRQALSPRPAVSGNGRAGQA